MAKRRNRKTNKVRVIKNPVVESVVVQEDTAVFVRKPDNFEKVINTLANILNSVEKYFFELLVRKVA